MPDQRAKQAATQPHVIRMVLVEEHVLVRAVLRDIIGSQPDIDILAEAANVDDAIEIVRHEAPDVVLVDTELPIALVVPSVQRLRRECPASPVVLLGHRRGEDELLAAIQAGAAAHVLDDTPPSELVRTIRAVADGEYLIADEVAARPAVARHVLATFQDASVRGKVTNDDLEDTGLASLSAREVEILEAIARGLTNKGIGEALSISDQTVKHHVTSILRKLAVNDRLQAVLYALRKSWISIEDEPPPRD